MKLFLIILISLTFVIKYNFCLKKFNKEKSLLNIEKQSIKLVNDYYLDDFKQKEMQILVVKHQKDDFNFINKQNKINSQDALIANNENLSFRRGTISGENALDFIFRKSEYKSPKLLENINNSNLNNNNQQPSKFNDLNESGNLSTIIQNTINGIFHSNGDTNSNDNSKFLNNNISSVNTSNSNTSNLSNTANSKNVVININNNTSNNLSNSNTSNNISNDKNIDTNQKSGQMNSINSTPNISNEPLNVKANPTSNNSQDISNSLPSNNATTNKSTNTINSSNPNSINNAAVSTTNQSNNSSLTSSAESKLNNNNLNNPSSISANTTNNNTIQPTNSMNNSTTGTTIKNNTNDNNNNPNTTNQVTSNTAITNNTNNNQNVNQTLNQQSTNTPNTQTSNSINQVPINTLASVITENQILKVPTIYPCKDPKFKNFIHIKMPAKVCEEANKIFTEIRETMSIQKKPIKDTFLASKYNLLINFLEFSTDFTLYSQEIGKIEKIISLELKNPITYYENKYHLKDSPIESTKYLLAAYLYVPLDYLLEIVSGQPNQIFISLRSSYFDLRKTFSTLLRTFMDIDDFVKLFKLSCLWLQEIDDRIEIEWSNVRYISPDEEDLVNNRISNKKSFIEILNKRVNAKVEKSKLVTKNENFLREDKDDSFRNKVIAYLKKHYKLNK